MFFWRILWIDFFVFLQTFILCPMRKLKIVVLVVLVAVAAVACKSKTSVYKSPEKVTESFVKAFATADFENMYKYSVPANAVIIRNMQKTMRNYPEQMEKLQNNVVEVQKVSCNQINDSLAVCKCDFKMEDGDHNVEFRVKKMREKWLVDMSEN